MAAPLEPVGRIVRAHGLKGAVVARPASEGSDVLLHVEAVTVEHDGRRESRRVRSARWLARQIVLELDGAADRNEAEALVGATLLLSPDELPAAGEGELYRSELVGLEVVGPDGRRFGRVVDLESSPVQEWLVVDVGGREVLVPFTRGLVRVERAAGRVVVDAPEGLFEGEAVS